MNAYPPPQPQPGAPASGRYPGYDRRAWKEQQRAAKRQMKLQREQIHLQARAMRRGSLVGPVLIVALGVIFLLAQTGRLSWPNLLRWYGTWWPVVLIGAGSLLLLEWLLDQRLRQTNPTRPARTVGGGIVFLLVLLAIAGSLSHTAIRGFEWKQEKFGSNFPLWNLAFGERHDVDDTLNGAIAPGGALLIRNHRGDITVTGASEDGQVHVSIHKQIRAQNDQQTEERRQKMQPVFSGESANLMLEAPAVDGCEEDLVVQVPRNTVLTVDAGHGTVTVEELHAAVNVTSRAGEVNLNGIGGPVTAHLSDSSSDFSAHSVKGGVSVEGHAGDINISDITGPVELHGEFFGTSHAARVNGPFDFRSKRTQFQLARLDGDLDIETHSDLRASEVMGPVVLHTAYRNITLDRVQGSVQIANRDGSVTVTNAAPLASIEITNHRGSVDVGVPENASFAVHAETQHGEVENDFGLTASQGGNQAQLSGTVGKGGPSVNIQTSDGDVTLRKSRVEPLPTVAPVAPRITMAPDAPSDAAPASAPLHAKAPKSPATPKTRMRVLPPVPPVPTSTPQGLP